MNWPGFFAFSNVWFLLLAAPIIIFYFLKLKRPRLQIPSLILWQQVLADHRVNSPFQRFKRNILLLLQLLILLFLVFAAMQPYFRGDADRAHNLPILVDNSASMAARDRNTNLTRLEQAKQRVQLMIDGMLPDQQFCLISFSSTARKLTGFTNNKRILTDALQAITVDDVPSNIEDALRMAQALNQNANFDTVLMLSDGNIPVKTDFALPYSLDFQKLDSESPNIGITALNARRASGNRWDIFVHIQSSSSDSTAATMQLFQDDNHLASEPLSVSNRQPERLTFQVAVENPTAIKLRLEPDGFDALAADNTAFLDLKPARPLAVYIPNSLGTFRNAFLAIPDIKVYPQSLADAENLDRTTFDLIITDQTQSPLPPEEDQGEETNPSLPPSEGANLPLPLGEGRGEGETPTSSNQNQETSDISNLSATVTFHVANPPADIADLLTIDDDGTEVIDWNYTDPLLQYVQLADLTILDNPVTQPDVRLEDYENRGYEILVHGRHGPLLLRKREGKLTSYALLFHPDRSTLPYRVAFPVLLSNLVKLTMHQLGLAETNGNTTGVLPPIQLTADQSYRITNPRNHSRDAQTSPVGQLDGIPAPFVGQYTIKRTGEPDNILGVSLLNEHETTLASVDQLQFNELAVTAAATIAKVDRSFWPTLTIIALVILLLEWWFFQKRPGGYS